MPKPYNCNRCALIFTKPVGILPNGINGFPVCDDCYEDYRFKAACEVNMKCPDPSATVENYNKPTHYHEHEIDTIEFLKKGFPPSVLTGFLIGNVIKYTQRFEYKNGEEDLIKVVDYANRLKDWYIEQQKDLG